MRNKIKIHTISSLEKVFPHGGFEENNYEKGIALKGETLSYQIAYRSEINLDLKIKVIASDSLKKYIQVRRVGLAPSEFPCYLDCDDYVLSRKPGLYPDPLYPLGGNEILKTYGGQWRSLWISVRIPDDANGGEEVITVEMTGEDKRVESSSSFSLVVAESVLSKQKLINTQWFHGDCLANYYGDDVFSENHWKRLKEQFENCTAHGMNMILTPIFTPPLDTKIGEERETIQLVDIYLDSDSYLFGFSKLNRWIDMAQETGFTYFEISHLTTQWGARYCPKIMAVEKGETKKIFGWETEALSTEYLAFLDQFLPALDNFLMKKGLKDNVYFHISDEPEKEHLEQFKKISHEIRSRLEGYKFIDALSDLEFYKSGTVPTPIASTDHIEPFAKAGIKELWAYYCCAQHKKVPNRFFNMPSARNRIMGMLLYKYEIKGFLHWGYNFYYSQYSLKKINPFLDTDAHRGFPSGDAFLVYPGEDGPIDSIRHEVFYEALQDLRALELLESLIGRDKVISLIENGLDNPLSFEIYPRSARWLLKKREEINKQIMGIINEQSKA